MTYSKIDIGVEQLCRSRVKIEEENLKTQTKKQTKHKSLNTLDWKKWRTLNNTTVAYLTGVGKIRVRRLDEGEGEGEEQDEEHHLRRLTECVHLGEAKKKTEK